MIDQDNIVHIDYDNSAMLKLGDGAAALGVLGTIMGWLPAVAAILGIIWYLILIFGWIEKRINDRKAAKARDPGGSDNPNYPNVQ